VSADCASADAGALNTAATTDAHRKRVVRIWSSTVRLAPASYVRLNRTRHTNLRVEQASGLPELWRRRAARRTDGQEEAFSEQLIAVGAAGIVQTAGARGRQDTRRGADEARAAGRAVLGRFQMAGDIVVRERRDDQEERINRCSDESEVLRPAAGRAVHLSR